MDFGEPVTVSTQGLIKPESIENTHTQHVCICIDIKRFIKELTHNCGGWISKSKFHRAGGQERMITDRHRLRLLSSVACSLSSLCPASEAF